MSKADVTTPRVNIRLRSARMKKRWNVSVVAHKLGVSESTYTRWEQGKQSPQLPNLDRLCEIFDTTPKGLGYSTLLGERDVEFEAGPQLEKELIRRLDRLHIREAELKMREKEVQIEWEKAKMVDAQLQKQSREFTREKEQFQKDRLRWEVLEKDRQQRLLNRAHVSPGDENE